ncbi:MAG: protein of unknown function cysteine-rich region domain protein, partial [Nocardioides sp.]|nr:protein of unknown function cysteine-rich region domain protein [Nocardioides sp.]
VEDFTWKGLLDMATCTECGRCQSQCPAWNTEKPLSPKLMIMALRDASFAKAPYLLASEGKREKLLAGSDTLQKEVDRPLVGDTGDDWFYMPEDGSGVIDPDVLWSCVTCGACVQQCPVDIEHVDHIVDMRRYQVLVESNFPAELNQLFRGLENKGNPWNMSATARMDWAKDLPFDVKVVGDDIESLDEVEWLFWVGCAGAYEDRAKKTTRAVAELLDMAGVSFGVLGNGETCTGDQARRAGNEFVFQGLAQQNVETFKEYKVKKVVSTCAHCFNTLKNEYQEFGIELEVVHHTQLLNRLVREGKLTPVKEGAGAEKRSITYHDPCYIGRHNGVYTPPRELLQVLPGADFVEMPRNSETSFCCGAGGARMWMEENIGERINVNRTVEAVATGADQIAVGCPFCRVMLSDGLTAQQAKGEAREEVEVLDVAQMLLASVKGEVATRTKPGGSAKAAPAAKPGTEDEATKSEPEAGDATQTEETVTKTEDVGPAAKASTSGGGSSLFDTPADEPEEKAEPADTAAAEGPAAKAAEPAKSGGSLFDLGSDEPEPQATPKAEPKADAARELEPEQAEEEPAAPAAAAGSDLGSSGSLFDFDAPAEEPKKAAAEPEAKADEPEPEPADKADEPEPEAKADAPEPKAAEPEPKAAPTSEIPTGSLFDIEAPEPTAAPEPAATAEPEAKESEPEAKESEPEAKEPEPEPEAKEPEPDAAAPKQAAPKQAAPTAEIPEGRSLFYNEPPEPAAAAAPAEPVAKEPEPEPEAKEPEPEPEAKEPEPEQASPDDASDLSPGAAISAAATAAAGSASGDAPAAETTAEESPEPEAPKADKPEPKAEGAEEPTESEEPKTGVDIDESGSLFDL